MNFTNTRYYEILGVTHDASVESINKARDRLMYGNADDRAPSFQMPEIIEAYGVLVDPDKRKEYDKYLAQNENSISDIIIEEPRINEQTPIVEVPDNTNTIEEATNDNVDIIQNDIVIEEPEVTVVRGNPQQQTINNLNRAAKFTEVNEKFKDMSFEYKLKALGKKVGGAIVVFAAGPATWAVVGGILIAKNKRKYKIHKNNKAKKMTPTQTEELREFQEYENNLNKQIDKLLAEPHNNYRLEINKKKYEAQIELLKKQLSLRSNRPLKGKIDMFFNKLQVMQAASQLQSAAKNLERVSKKIDDYDNDKTPRLSRLNKQLIDNAEELNNQQTAHLRTSAVTKLQVSQNKLLHKRNEIGTTMKHRIVRSGKFYDGIIKAKDFVKSRGYAFSSLENIDERVNEIQSDVENIQARTR